MSVTLEFTLTQNGLAAAWNASHTGTALNLTHVQFGSGNRAPDGNETALLTPCQSTPIAAGRAVSGSQVRMSAIFSGQLEYPISEIGLWAGEPDSAQARLVAYWSRPSGVLAVKTTGVDFIFSHDLTLDAALPAGALTILADTGQSALLAMIDEHEKHPDPHPQYTTEAEVRALIEERAGDYVQASLLGNTYTVALQPVVTRYNDKTAFAFKANAANPGATRLDAGGGPRALLRDNGTPLRPGDIAAGAVVTVVFDGGDDAFRITGMVSSQIAADLQTQLHTAIATAGVAPGFTGNVSPAITAYVAGQRFRLRFHAGVSGPSTLNLLDLGPRSLKQYDHAGTKVNAVVVANQLTDVEYDGSDFVLLDALPSLPIQPGEIQYFATSTAPVGYLKANGASVSRITYAALFAAIGTTFGSGNGSTTFNLPDLRGEFVRGWDDGRGLDTGRNFGSLQSGQNLSHHHGGATGSAGAHSHSAWTDSQGYHSHSVLVYRANDFNSGGYVTGSDDPHDGGAWVNGTSGAGSHNHNTGVGNAPDHWHAIGSDGGTEARPRNIALLACIKF